MPLVVPTVNLGHLDVIRHQRQNFAKLIESKVAIERKKADSAVSAAQEKDWAAEVEAAQSVKPSKGFLVCNSNCAVIGLVIPFAALQAKYGPIDVVSVVTMQAVSGAGYPGVSSMDIIDNVVPFISGEEDKLQQEAQKILGAASATGFEVQSGLKVSAACNRVAVLDGHMACVSLKFKNGAPQDIEEVKQSLRDYVPEAKTLGCPSAPSQAIVVMEEPDRPQPRLDRETDRGYAVSVGRVRKDDSGIFDLQFVALSHNSKSTRLELYLAQLTPYSRHRSRGLVDTERRGGGQEGPCVKKCTTKTNVCEPETVSRFYKFV